MDENKRIRSQRFDKTTEMENRELRLGRPLEEVLREEVESGKTWGEIALSLDVSMLTLRDWRRRLRIQRVTQHTLISQADRAP